MIREISISNLRGIRGGELKGLTPLVVLVGPNNSGKSTVLDAAFIGANDRPDETLKFLASRRGRFDQSHQWLFFRDSGQVCQPGDVRIISNSPQNRRAVFGYMAGNPGNQIVIATVVADKNVIHPPVTPAFLQRGNVSAPALGDVPAIHLVDPNNLKTPLHEVYTTVAQRGLTRQAIEIVKTLIPSIDDVQILTDQGKPTMYIFSEDGVLPLGVAGDGVRLLLEMSLQVAAPAGGVVLLEEPETHMHPGAIRQVARVILAAVSRGIQLIVTTHSLELIDSLLAQTPTDKLDELSFYRLQLRNGHLQSVRRTGTEAALARTEIQDDLR